MKIERNKTHEYLQACIDRCYDPNDNYSWTDYNKEEVEWIPLDLSAYPKIKEETKKRINYLFNEETQDRNGRYMLRGFTRNEYQEMNLLSLVYGNYANALSYYAYNDEEMLVYTYCEGDTTLKMYNDLAEYEAEKESCREFYEEE